MNDPHRTNRRSPAPRPATPPATFALALLACLATPAAAPGAEQTQALTIEPGWNAVWLEVSPLLPDGAAATVEDVFSSSDIQTVARPVRPVGTEEFIVDPTKTFNQEGWVVWNRGSASGNTLTRVRGNQAYLIYNASRSTPVVASVTGEVQFFVPAWSPGNYNLVGFGIGGSPTFGDFFGPTGSSDGVHPIGKTFTLDPGSGNWESVSATDTIQAGTAYWVFAERNSNFAGPVAIGFDGARDLSFGTSPEELTAEDADGADVTLTTRELTFTNVDTVSHAVTITKIDPATTGTDANADDLRLYRVVPVPDELDYTLDPALPLSSWSTGSLPSATSLTTTLGANRKWTGGGNFRTNLYRIDIGLGSGSATQHFWLPVEAARTGAGDELPGTPDSAYAGLWVGQVNLDAVTSTAEAGAPLVSTTSVLPLQVIIHVDSSGNPSLLSHVLFMQRRTADESVPPVPVLVVDETRIPFFEGIAVRDGKRIGRRIEAVAFDMPLKYVAAEQPEHLLVAIAEADGLTDGSGSPDPALVTDAHLEAYALAQPSRPAGMVDDYELTWPLTGGLGPGVTVGTGASPLRLDPYHRSNPFRHAYHPDHGTGIAVSRSFTITFDNTDGNGLLQGTYSESIDNLTASGAPLVASGRVTLRRVSDIAELQ